MLNLKESEQNLVHLTPNKLRIRSVNFVEKYFYQMHVSVSLSVGLILPNRSPSWVYWRAPTEIEL